ncbi:MAG: DNA polymerase III subunit delta [Actinomycetota bacterium]
MAVLFLKGDDETLMAQAVGAAVKDLVGDGDRGLMVEELTEEHWVGDDGGDPSLAALITAAMTPPFLTERRVVVGRNLALFSKAAQVLPLIELLAAPPDTTDLVLVWERGANTNRMPAVPKPLTEALKSAGAETSDVAPSGRGRKALLEDKLATAPVQFDTGARKLIVDRVGDDVGRLASIFETLAATFGPEAKVGADDVAPFLGEASDVPPWELTDAIDDGNIGLALDNLDRMTVGGDRHPLQTLATLHNHYQRVLRLDGAGATDEKTAAAVLGMSGSTFPARKALNLSRKLGRERTRRAVALLAAADLDLRGNTALPAETVMTVLVARLARLSR